MTDEAPEDTSVEDITEASLRSWGLSGMPVTWAWVSWQPVISIIRAANTGFADQAAVQMALDVVFPNEGYLAANVCLAHAPSAVFVITPGDIDPDVDPTVYVDVIRVELADDEDLGLPDEQVTWEFGDGTPPVHDIFGWEHGYVAHGTYVVRCTIPVTGVVYSTTQSYTTVEAGQATPAVTEGPYDPADHTVAEVLAYVADHPDEAEAIYQLEEAGKARSTILDKI